MNPVYLILVPGVGGLIFCVFEVVRVRLVLSGEASVMDQLAHEAGVLVG